MLEKLAPTSGELIRGLNEKGSWQKKMYWSAHCTNACGPILNQSSHFTASDAILSPAGREKKNIICLIASRSYRAKCSSTTTNPVCEGRVNLLVYSLSLHRHSYIGFILAFASSIHNKQTNNHLVYEVCKFLSFSFYTRRVDFSVFHRTDTHK